MEPEHKPYTFGLKLFNIWKIRQNEFHILCCGETDEDRWWFGFRYQKRIVQILILFKVVALYIQEIKYKDKLDNKALKESHILLKVEK